MKYSHKTPTIYSSGILWDIYMLMYIFIAIVFSITEDNLYSGPKADGTD